MAEPLLRSKAFSRSTDAAALEDVCVRVRRGATSIIGSTHGQDDVVQRNRRGSSLPRASRGSIASMAELVGRRRTRSRSSASLLAAGPQAVPVAVVTSICDGEARARAEALDRPSARYSSSTRQERSARGAQLSAAAADARVRARCGLTPTLLLMDEPSQDSRRDHRPSLRDLPYAREEWLALLLIDAEPRRRRLRSPPTALVMCGIDLCGHDCDGVTPQDAELHTAFLGVAALAEQRMAAVVSPWHSRHERLSTRSSPVTGC